MNQLSVFAAAVLVRPDFTSKVLFTILPFVIVCALLVYLFHSSQKKYRKYLDRSVDHMNALEKKTDRVIELLEEINKQK